MGSSVNTLAFYLSYVNLFISGNNLTSRSEVAPTDSVSELLDILYLRNLFLGDVTVGFEEEETKKSFLLRSEKEVNGLLFRDIYCFLFNKNLLSTKTISLSRVIRPIDERGNQRFPKCFKSCINLKIATEQVSKCGEK